MRNIKRIYSFLFLLIIGDTFVVQGQGFSSFPSITTAANINLGEAIGSDFLQFKNQDIKGTPFLTDSFLYCHVWLFDNKTYSIPKMRLNLLTQKLHFLNETGSEFTTTGETIKKAVFFSDEQAQNTELLTISCGYPKISDNSEYTFYQQMNNGTVVLLKNITKTLITHPAVPSLPLTKEYVENSSYYIYNSKTKIIQKLKKSRDFILNFLFQKKIDVQAFIDSNNINVRSQADLIKVLNYYNTLD